MRTFREGTSASVGVPFALLVFVSLTAGCAARGTVANGAPQYAGTFEASCSPVDAPGTRFELYRLGDAFPAQVSISIWEYDFPIDESVIELGGRSGYGSAYISGTEWIPAKDGEVGLESYVEGELARGWFWLNLDQVDRVEGRFEATWSDEGPAICG